MSGIDIFDLIISVVSYVVAFELLKGSDEMDDFDDFRW